MVALFLWHVQVQFMNIFCPHLRVILPKYALKIIISVSTQLTVIKTLYASVSGGGCKEKCRQWEGTLQFTNI